MSVRPDEHLIAALKEQIDKIAGGTARMQPVLPFHVDEIDHRLPRGGLALGALHEVAGGGDGAIDGASAALFSAGIAARTTGPVLWCLTKPDLFPPFLTRVGLALDRVIFVEAPNETMLLDCFEECLRQKGVGAVIGEVARLPMTASRRLQLAAESSGVLGIALRRWRRQSEATDFGHPTAAATRWRVSPLPSVPLPVQGVGRARWMLELLRARAGESADFEVEACDGNGLLAPVPQVASRRRVAGGYA